MRTSVLPIAFGLLAAALPGPAGGASAPALEQSPPGHVLVVNNNVQEAFRQGDVADPTDMENFARRVGELVPYAPDVVILQEVVGPSALNIATFLSERIGRRYVVAIAPGDSAFSGDAEEQIVRDTAIVVNAETIRVEDDGGYIATTYDPEDAADEEDRRRTKEHAYLVVTEIDGDLQMPLTSLHFVLNRLFVSDEIAWENKSQWAQEIASFLNKTYPPRDQRYLPVIAGDYNNRRCDEADETVDCKVQPFWSAMTDELDYVDAIFEVQREGEIGTRKRIDYLFGRGRVIDAASDLDYSQEDKADPSRFYSDHRIIWSLVAEPERD